MRLVPDAPSALPRSMAAATFDGAGGPEVVTVGRQSLPEPAPGEILIRVEAGGLNRADVQQRRGFYAPPEGATDIPGLEVSGTVAGYGRGVSEDAYPLGTPVCALLAGGGYAEFVSVPVSQVLHVPTGLSVVEAGGLMEVACTVVSNLSHTAQVRPGDWVLVHGGSGGIGSFALQYLREMGVNSIATGSTPRKLAWAEEHGATHTVDYKQEDFAERVMELTQGHGVDVILDVVGAKYLAANVRALATGGRLVIIGMGGGTRAELNIGELMGKRASIHATTLRARPEEEKAAIVASVGQRVWPLIESGRITVDVDRTFPLMQARAAHEYFDSGEHRGKVLLTM